MKLLKLEVEGYRSLKQISWTPGDLNVLIGPNGSGKTNVIRVLEMLSVCASGGLGKRIQREGGMLPLLWDGTADMIRVRIETSPVDPYRSTETDSLTYSLELSRLGKTSAFRIEKEQLANFFKVKEGWEEEPFKLLDRDPRHAAIFDEEQRAFAAHESVPEDETLLSLAGGPFAQNQHLWAYKGRVGSWAIFPVLDASRYASIRQAPVVRHETVVYQDGSNFVSVFHTLYTNHREFKRYVDLAMRAAFSDDFEEFVFPPDADLRIQLKTFWKSLGRPVPWLELSDGTVRFVFLLAVLANPDPPPLLAIEEPEVGLHPSMFPIIAEFAAEAARRTQVILTTHSPEFLNAFKEVTPTTSVFESVGGETRIRVLSGEDLQYWLKEYALGDYLFHGGVGVEE